jgi:hypothetical protein
LTIDNAEQKLHEPCEGERPKKGPSVGLAVFLLAKKRRITPLSAGGFIENQAGAVGSKNVKNTAKTQNVGALIASQRYRLEKRLSVQ